MLMRKNIIILMKNAGTVPWLQTEKRSLSSGRCPDRKGFKIRIIYGNTFPRLLIRKHEIVQ